MSQVSKNHRPADPAPPDVNPVDRQTIARAYQKVMAGQELTRTERTLLKQHEKAKEEKLRWQYYASIPQKHWRAMSGRQTKVINEQATRYGIPFGGPFIDLRAVAKALHDFLAANAQRLAREDDALLEGPGSPALERYREERATMARLDREERQAQLLPRVEVRAALGRIAALLRAAGETLQRQYGAGAVDILQEALAEAQREIDRSFGVDGADAPDPR